MEDRTVLNQLHGGSSQSSLACKSCRKRKLKCDRNIPQCRHCQKVSRVCEYPAVAQKPGPRPGSHRRSVRTDTKTIRKHRAILVQQPVSQSSADVLDDQISPNDVSTHHEPTGDLDESETSQVPGSNRSSSDVHFVPTGSSTFSIACREMKISHRSCSIVIETFFLNVTTYSLFHQPTFAKKLCSITSAKVAQALLTTLLAISLRFIEPTDIGLDHGVRTCDLLAKAHELSLECLKEYSDDTPSIHLLQALILQTFIFSTIGIRGRAWRMVGQCIRLAYEMRLHEVDLGTLDRQAPSEMDVGFRLEVQPSSRSESWISLEERRRAWWAIWELDVFASTIQRLPNAVDWTRSRTNFPSTDEAWFENRPATSCYFQVDPNKRWKALRDCRNTSPIAWFILLNSYKWESLAVTQRIPPPTNYFDQNADFQDSSEDNNPKSILRRKREMLENCVRSALAAMPSILQPNSFLTFSTSHNHPHSSVTRALDHGIYAIHIMSQITQLFLTRKDLHGGGDYIAYPLDTTTTSTDKATQSSNSRGSHRWRRCLFAADQVANLVRNSSPTHHRHVNPNIATALWMAAATHLAVLTYHADQIDAAHVRSNFDLLATTMDSFVQFWDVPKTLTSSLVTLESQLKGTLGARQTAGSREGRHPIEQQEEEGPQRGGEHREDPNNDTTGTDMSGLNSSVPHVSIGPLIDDPAFELSPFDVLQAMDFGAMYNGVEGWENLFLEPGFMSTGYP